MPEKMKNDTISRQVAIDAVKEASLGETEVPRLTQRILDYLERQASAEPEIVHCEDCKWWDRSVDRPTVGYCNAAKHGHMSRHWEISIYRVYESNFFCADAERRE